MLTPIHIGLLFLALSLLFLGLSLWDYIRSKGEKTPARRAWLRVGILFGITGTVLCLLNS